MDTTLYFSPWEKKKSVYPKVPFLYLIFCTFYENYSAVKKTAGEEERGRNKGSYEKRELTLMEL